MRTIDARSRRLGVCLLALAAALAALSVLGPLVAGVIHWRIGPTILSQLYGLDAVSLAVVAPVAAAAGALSLRGRPLGALLGIGPAAYAVYMVPQYVLGPDYAHVAGDNERWFPLLLSIFVVGVVASALAWSALRTSEPRGSARVEALVGRRLLPAAAAVVFVRYVPTLADWMSASPRRRTTSPARASAGRSRCSISASPSRPRSPSARATATARRGRVAACTPSPDGSRSRPPLRAGPRRHARQDPDAVRHGTAEPTPPERHAHAAATRPSRSVDPVREAPLNVA
jgi:hypothetical protein